jgi:hypothetical protein
VVCALHLHLEGVLLIYTTLQQVKVNGEVCTYNEECLSKICGSQKCVVRFTTCMHLGDAWGSGATLAAGRRCVWTQHGNIHIGLRAPVSSH